MLRSMATHLQFYTFYFAKPSLKEASLDANVFAPIMNKRDVSHAYIVQVSVFSEKYVSVDTMLSPAVHEWKLLFLISMD